MRRTNVAELLDNKSEELNREYPDTPAGKTLFNDIFDEYIEKCAYNITEFIQDLGITRPTFYRIYYGEHAPNLKTARKIAKYYSVRLDDLVFLKELFDNGK